jgi:hypothetical protein
MTATPDAFKDIVPPLLDLSFLRSRRDFIAEKVAGFEPLNFDLYWLVLTDP